MKLIAISKPEFFIEEDKIISLLFDEGLDILHLRKPLSCTTYMERLLTLIPEKYHNQIVLHEHFELKEEFNLRGIHLSSRNPLEPEAYNGHISCSCHSTREVEEQKNDYDYVFMGPIFDSITKENYPSLYTSEQLREATQVGIIDKKVIALGGITLDNILEIKDYGFGGAAVLGDLWGKFNTCKDQDYLEVIKHFRKLKDMAD